MSKNYFFCILCVVQWTFAFGNEKIINKIDYEISTDLIFISDTEEDQHKFNPREITFELSGNLGENFKGLVSISAHKEIDDEEIEIDLHEAFLKSDNLFKSIDFKLGQYFLGVGILNKSHRHHWEFISAPRVHFSFFGNEGLIDSGIEFNLHFGHEKQFVITGGLATGKTLTHSHDENEVDHESSRDNPVLPTNYINFNLEFEKNRIENRFGISLINMIDEKGDQSIDVGFDVNSLIKDDQTNKHHIQSEVWFRINKFENGETDKKEFGFYISYVYGISNHWFVGLRGEAFYLLDEKFNNEDHQDLRGTLLIKYSHNKNLNFSASYTYGQEEIGTQKSVGLFEFQVTFIFTSIESHDHLHEH